MIEISEYVQARKSQMYYYRNVPLYEALTNDDRPYRSALETFDTLRIIREDVKKDKYSKEIYLQFVSSLGGVLK